MLLFDEEEDVLKEDVPLKEIDYNIIKKSKKISGLTRREAKIVLLLSKYLDKIYENKKNDEIKYMYFECFNKVEEDNEKAYKNLKNEVLKANLNVIETLKTLIKVLKN
jgi:hypothetical protein